MILVTGGAGFIGSHLVRALAAAGEEIRVVDNLSVGRLENLDGIIDSVDWIEGDIRDRETVQRSLTGVSTILHLAALTSVDDSLEDPAETLKVNVEGTANLLDVGRRCGLKKFVFMSSAAVYGANPDLPWSETAEPSPQSPYAVSKLTGEHYCRLFQHLYGMSTVVLRCFNVYGPRQKIDSDQAALIPRSVTRLLAGEELVIYGDGRQRRDFVFVEDVVRASLAALDPAIAGHQVFNVASGRTVDLIGLVGELEAVTGRTAGVRFVEPRPGDMAESAADITKAVEVLGCRRPLSLTEGLKRTVEWFERPNEFDQPEE